MSRRVGIVGSRNFNDPGQVRRFVQSLPKDTEVVSGGARGVDSVAAHEAVLQGLGVRIFYPDYEFYGASAPLKRNYEIVKYSDEIVAFWDGKSTGTMHTVSIAKENNKPVTVHKSRLDK